MRNERCLQTAVRYGDLPASVAHHSKRLFMFVIYHHHHHHLFLNHEGRWGTTGDFATSLLHFSLFLHCPLGLGELQACPFPEMGNCSGMVVFRLSGLAKTNLQGTVKGGRRQGRQKKRWEDNIRKWNVCSYHYITSNDHPHIVVLMFFCPSSSSSSSIP